MHWWDPCADSDLTVIRNFSCSGYFYIFQIFPNYVRTQSYAWMPINALGNPINDWDILENIQMVDSTCLHNLS